MTDNIPSTLPFLPLRNGVLFPGTAISLPMGRRRSLQLLQQVHEGDLVAVGVQRDPKQADPGIADVFPMATLARVRQVQQRGRDGRLMVEGLRRVHIDNLIAVDPFWRIEASEVSEVPASAPDAERATAELGGALDELGPLPEALEELLG